MARFGRSGGERHVGVSRGHAGMAYVVCRGLQRIDREGSGSVQQARFSRHGVGAAAKRVLDGRGVDG